MRTIIGLIIAIIFVVWAYNVDPEVVQDKTPQEDTKQEQKLNPGTPEEEE